MTLSAPSERTSSCFDVLHTPVTCAPQDFAIWTANVPIPPPAPTIRTFCPAWRRPESRSAWSAVSAAIPVAAPCSKVMLAGFGTRRSSLAAAYSAKVPLPTPNTSSPIDSPETFPPIASTVPARSVPRMPSLGLRSPNAAHDVWHAMHARPVRRVHGGGTNTHQDFVVADAGNVDVLDPHGVRRAVLGLNDCLHGPPDCCLQCVHPSAGLARSGGGCVGRDGCHGAGRWGHAGAPVA